MAYLTMKRAGSAAGLLWLLALGGCAEGWRADAAQTRTWLPGALPDLRRIIVLLRTCQPRRPSDYNTVWAADADGGTEAIHCTFGGTDAPLAEIRSKLRESDVLGVAYTPSGSATQPVTGADFILFREGLVPSGASTSLEYHLLPQPCTATSEGSARQGYRLFREPVGQAPCRWFWEHDEN